MPILWQIWSELKRAIRRRKRGSSQRRGPSLEAPSLEERRLPAATAFVDASAADATSAFVEGAAGTSQDGIDDSVSVDAVHMHDHLTEGSGAAVAGRHAPQVISVEPTVFSVVARNEASGIGASVRSLQFYLSDPNFEPSSLPPIGIAVVGTDAGDGRWQYTTDFGRSWRDVGHVSDRSALLLEPDARLRFVPGRTAERASFEYRGWDLSQGTSGERADTIAPEVATPGHTARPGNSAFSAQAGTATALVWTLAAPRSPMIDAAGRTELAFTLSGPEDGAYMVLLDWGDGASEEFGTISNGTHTARHTYTRGWSAGRPTPAMPVVIEAFEMISDDYEPGSTRLPLLAVSEDAAVSREPAQTSPVAESLPPASSASTTGESSDAPDASPPLREIGGLSAAAGLALGAFLASDSNWSRRVDEALESSEHAERLRRIRRMRRK